jgi:hypothetical protein
MIDTVPDLIMKYELAMSPSLTMGSPFLNT